MSETLVSLSEEAAAQPAPSSAKRAATVDKVTMAAVDLARAAAEEAAEDFGVGDYVGAVVEDGRVVTHFFACPHPGYVGWQWAVTLVRAARAKDPTVNEVVLLPSEQALLAPKWIPWSERLEAGDIAPGTLLPTPDNDPRLEPGYTGAELRPDEDPVEWALTRSIAAELGLGRERVLSPEGKRRAAERWLAGEAGSHDAASRQAPAPCLSCGYWVRVTGQLGRLFGVCTNEYSPFDARVTATDHGCGGHSDVVADERPARLPSPVYDTIKMDQSLFD